MNRPNDIPASAETVPSHGWAYAPGPDGTTRRAPALPSRDRIIPFARPERRAFPLGDFACAADAGTNHDPDDSSYSPNEDAQFATPDGSAFGVVDGMGGRSCPQQASDILSGRLESRLEGSLRPADDCDAAVEESHDRMVRLMGEGSRVTCGAVFSAVRLAPGRADVFWLGDARAILIRDGRVARSTTVHRSHEFRAAVARFVGSDLCIPPDRDSWELLPGDFVVVASDGLWDNVTPDEAAALLAGCRDAADAVRLLGAARDRMLSHGSADGKRPGVPDDTTIQALLYRGPAA